MENIYSKLNFNLLGRKFYGHQVVNGIALGLAITSVYALRTYFAGGWCYTSRDLSGRNVLITGASTGIGRQTARKLVELGANVIIASRNMEKNTEVVDELNQLGKGKAVAFKLDLADKASIESFANDVKRYLGAEPLHILINNAGVMAVPQRRLTKDGFQYQMGVNHLGHFYLTYLLWQKLKQSNNPRIINLSSSAHKARSEKFDIDFYNLNFESGGYGMYSAYSRSKKANILFTKQLQARMEAEGINGTVVCVHPGLVRTELSNTFLNTWWKKALAYALMLPFYLLCFKTAKQGAQTTIYCAVENDNGLSKGGYYVDCKLSPTYAPQVQSREAARRLWEESEKAFGIQFNV